MTQLILKNDISPYQLNTLLQLLRAWNIEAEAVPAVAGEGDKAPTNSCLTGTDWFKRIGLDESDFDDDLDPIDPNDPLAGMHGMWENYNINARDLRRGILPDEAYSTIDFQNDTLHGFSNRSLALKMSCANTSKNQISD
jgi:hypothetical protein